MPDALVREVSFLPQKANLRGGTAGLPRAPRGPAGGSGLCHAAAPGLRGLAQLPGLMVPLVRERVCMGWLSFSSEPPGWPLGCDRALIPRLVFLSRRQFEGVRTVSQRLS